MVTSYSKLAEEFLIVNGEFSDLRCLMNTLLFNRMEKTEGYKNQGKFDGIWLTK